MTVFYIENRQLAVHCVRKCVQFVECDIAERTIALCVEIHLQTIDERGFGWVDNTGLFFAEQTEKERKEINILSGIHGSAKGSPQGIEHQGFETILQNMVHRIEVTFYRIKLVASEQMYIVMKPKDILARWLEPMETKYCLLPVPFEMP
jgi:hypothetical protein